MYFAGDGTYHLVYELTIYFFHFTWMLYDIIEEYKKGKEFKMCLYIVYTSCV